MTPHPESQREKDFSLLWQQKRYEEALNTSFPDQWVWFAEHIDKESVCAYPTVAGAGEVMSEDAFSVIHEAFPFETRFNHPLEIDGYKFIWFSPPVVEKADFNSTQDNIFMAKPLYRTVYSEDFVNLWKLHRFTDHEFVEITKP